MNFDAENMQRDLQTYAALCDEMLALAAHENQVLRETDDFAHAPRDRRRKELLARLERALDALRLHRMAWQKLPAAERARHGEITRQIGVAQQLAMKLIVLNREQEQELLRRGRVPARHLNSVRRAPPQGDGAYLPPRTKQFS